MKLLITVLGAAVLILALIFGLSFLFALATQYLVNYLFTTAALTTIFGVAKITFWQAFWLNVLCGILFKNTNVSSGKD